MTVAAVLAIGGGIASAVDRYGVVVNGQTTMLWCAVLALLIQIVAWIPASLKQTETYFDLTGGLTYIGLVVLSLWFGNRSTHRVPEWIERMVILWATRLASFLAFSERERPEIRRTQDKPCALLGSMELASSLGLSHSRGCPGGEPSVHSSPPLGPRHGWNRALGAWVFH